MKKYILQILSAAAILGLASCEKDATFIFNEGEGLLDCEGMTVDYVNSTRASVDPDDFTVYFINQSGVSVKSYKYSELPSLVSLPAGEYTVMADYGENPDGEFESDTNFGYYKGATSSSFEIVASTVSQLPETTIECSLNNIRIRVNVDDYCFAALTDVSVDVSVGTTTLNFDQTTNNKNAYFKYIEDSNSITATLYGKLDGEEVSNTVSYTPGEGKTFVVSFTANQPDNNDPGSVGTGSSDDSDNSELITIDSSITLDDSITQDVNIEDIDTPLGVLDDDEDSSNS